MTAPHLLDLPANVTFDENTVNTGPQLLAGYPVFADFDGNFDGSTLTVSGLLTEDVVSIRNEGGNRLQIGYSEGNLAFGGVTIGTVSGGVGEPLNITFNGNASATAIESAIRNLTYFNASDTPVAVRTLTLQITDAAGENLTPDIFSALSGVANPFNGLSAGTYSAPSVVDLDGDGDLDLVSGEAGGALKLWNNNGGVFTAQTGAANFGEPLIGACPTMF